MPTLTIDGKTVTVTEGTTLVDAAASLGIAIPTMCLLNGHPPQTHCMICLVRIQGRSGLVPACATRATEGLRVVTEDEGILASRRAGLELMLSDHVGDCMGPCRIACPAHMEIPLMLRQIAAGRVRQAIEIVKRDIALPAVLGRICPAPCEKVCRRAQVDAAVSICLLKRFAADRDLAETRRFVPLPGRSLGKKVAVVGAGPAGLSAAYYLRCAGIDCTVFDERPCPGGRLRDSPPADRLPSDVVDGEIAVLRDLGVVFRTGMRIGRDLTLEALRKGHDAVFVAVGACEPKDLEALGLSGPGGKVQVHADTYQTQVSGVFAGGDAIRRRRLAVRSVADGKEAAAAMGQFLAGLPVSGATQAFNTRIGRLEPAELEHVLSLAARQGRTEPQDLRAGLSADQARSEALRCLHCDCRKAETCGLRTYSHRWGARPGAFKSQRRPLVIERSHASVIYEPGKCIDCGICVQIASRAREKLGLTFIGRGFDVRVAVPFDRPLSEGLTQVGEEIVSRCPTGAMAMKDS